MLEDAQGACVEMPKPDKIDKSLDGELVCATAMANTDEVLTDADFGISENAISLSRKVEYYQWVEHSESKSEDKLGGKQETTTTYTYKQEWVSSPVNSADFKDPAYQGKNYTWTTVEDQDVWAEKVTFGAYVLNESLIHSISSTEPIELDVDFQTLQSMNKSVADTYARIKGNTAVIADAVTNLADTTETATNGNQVDLDFVHQAGNVIYYGRTANAPEVGDVRITFEKTVPAKVTVVSVVEGNTFKPFVASNKKKFQTLRMGKKSIDEIFEEENESNTMWTWILRIVKRRTRATPCGLGFSVSLVSSWLSLVSRASSHSSRHSSRWFHSSPASSHSVWASSAQSWVSFTHSSSLHSHGFSTVQCSASFSCSLQASSYGCSLSMAKRSSLNLPTRARLHQQRHQQNKQQTI